MRNPKTLILYFSRHGETFMNGDVIHIEKGHAEIVAEFLRDQTGAELFQVVPETPYSSDYMTCVEEAKRDREADARPPLRYYPDRISSYENIIVVGPIWWGTYPQPIFSALDGQDYEGKRIFPVSVHGRTDPSGCAASLRDLCRGGRVAEELSMYGVEIEENKGRMKQWVRRNQLSEAGGWTGRIREIFTGARDKS